jgi:hypothetical protein
MNTMKRGGGSGGGGGGGGNSFKWVLDITAWYVLRLPMQELASRYGRQLRIY